MTDKELIKIVTESKYSNSYKEFNCNFNFEYVDYNETFTGLDNVYKYITTQIKGWESYEQTLPPVFQNSKAYFISIRDSINSLIEQDDKINESGIINRLSSINNTINYIRDKPFPYHISQTIFLIEIFNKRREAFHGAYHFLTNNIQSVSFTNNKNTFIGVLLAYEYSIKDESDIYKRSKSEKRSLTQLRNEFLDKINDSEINLNKYYENTYDNYNKHTELIDDLKDSKETSFNDWFSETKEKFESFYSISNEKKTELENTYHDLLKLQAPAQYWKQRATILKKEGRKFMFLLISLVLIGSISLYLLLWHTPEDMLKSIFDGEKTKAIRWSIVFITFISFLFFGIRAVTKAMFSSYHLARDAEEREHLSFFYLSLLKESSVDKEDRQLILQSLFSRSDSGLLKEDSSPTMPGGINNIIGGNH
ncbi:DUF6161 domain-containing protein [Flavobacterium sp. ST-75]|uniref:DUF6161 domain-containing protein n=1 Tax=Flavobacterium rhizophilum TaxID=3163296 RepID=A0ABW8Y9Y7_9FLAO